MKVSEKDNFTHTDKHGTSRAVQVPRPEGAKDINSAVTQVQQQTLLVEQQEVKQHGQRWPQTPLRRHLNCSWGVLASPLPASRRCSGDRSALRSSAGPWSHRLLFRGIILSWRKTVSWSLWAGGALNCQPWSSAGCSCLLPEKQLGQSQASSSSFYSWFILSSFDCGY